MSRSLSTNCADLSRLAEMPSATLRKQLVAGLREQLGQWGEATRANDPRVFSCGAAAIDRLLPHGGLRHGMVVEWINTCIAAGGPAVATGGAATLGLLSAGEACREGGVLVVVDRARTFYPPAAAAWGIDLGRLVMVWPQNVRDELWATVQALRSPVVAAVWAPIERLDSRAFRRLQLAAEVGRTLGVLVRSARARGQPSWADVRLEVESRAKSRESRARGSALRSRLSTLDSSRCLHIHITHCRGGRAGGQAIVEIDDVQHTVREVSLTYDTHPLPVVAELGDPTSPSHSARA